MKKLILLLSLIAILALSTLGFADTVQIGSGTATTSYLPIYGLYGYTYSQQIYLQTQINKSGEITKLRFFYVSGAITNSKDWVIYMGHTTKTTFSSTTDWVPLANLTQVFAGDVSSYLPPANNWMEIPLTTPFNYNNTDNLVIAVDENTPNYASMSWGAFTSGDNTGIYYRNDSVNPDPANPPTASGRTNSINRIQLAFPNTSAPLAPTLLAPANGSWAFTNDILSWTPTLGGGDPTAYDVYFGTSSNNLNLVSSNQTATTYAPTLVAGNIYYWKVVARNEFGDSPPSDIWSFKTPTTTQLAESFENTTFPPAGWVNPGSWTRSTTYAKHGTASAYKYGGATTQYILSTPKVTITSTSTLDFWALCSLTTGTLQIVYSPDRITWTQIGSISFDLGATNTWYHYVIDLSGLAGNNYYLGIRTGLQAASYYVDSVIGPETTPEAPGPVTLTSPPNGATMVSIQPTFTWTAPTTGGVPTGYKVYCDTNNPPTTEIADVPGLTYTAAVPLLNNTQYYWTVKAYNIAGGSTTPPPFSFTTVEQGYVIIGTGTADLDMPVNPYYGYTYSQSIYLQSELNIENQRIEKIYYYWNGVGAAVNSNNWTVYMGHTPNASFTSISEWIPLSNLTQVFSGTVTLPAVAGWIEIVLNNPFIYDNVNNLVIAVDENAPNYDSSSQFFYCTSVATNRSLRYYDDNTNPDPAAPPAGTLVMGYPNVMLKFGEIPQAPIFYYSPTSIAFGTTFVNTPTAYQNVTVTNTGAGVLNLAVADVSIIGTNASMFNVITSNLPAALSSGQSVIIPVRYNPTAIGSHTATLRMVYNSTNYDVALSGNALGEHALYESFEGDTFPPTGWSTAPTPWGIYTVYAHTGTKSVKSGFTAGTWWLMTPTLAIEEGANTLTFWYRDYSESSGWDYVDEYTYVMLSTTGNAPENFTTTLWTGDYQTFTTTWQMASIDLSAYNGQNVVIAFKSVHTGGNYRIIDDVAGPNIYVPSGPPDPVTLVYPANGATGLPQVGFNLTWTPATTGGLPDYYAVYMSQSDETIYDDYYWETTNTSFNPVTAPTNPITFNYGERWYWTVEAINDDGNAVVEPPYSFEIVKPIQIFPWTENFDAALTLPAGWTMYDLDGAGTFWQVSSTYSHSSPNSFKHGYSTAVPEGQNGWLITPPVQIPTTGHYVLSWWNYNVYPAWMVYNGLKVNTTDDPNDPNWIELWSPASVASAWSNAVVNITPYAGQTVYFAFNYQGYNADDWYIDDVSIYELIADEFPPIITHLPVLNTPRDDINYLVYAEITDDPNWNNPIGGANLYYSTDSGTTWSEPIAMTPGTAPEYTAYIPAQPLGTTVDYYLEAWDSEMNMATTDTYSFSVNNPTWIRYDTGGTVYLGYSAYIFGPTMLYENPYYGTGIPLKLLETDGESYDATTANLHIYSFDGVTMTDLITPLAVSFPAQTHQIFDLSSYDINITTPYFLISYEDIPAGNYFLWDDTYDYGTTFVRISGQLYTLGDRTGAWCIGAYVTNGISAIETPVVTIYNVAGNPVLSWNAVSGANGYKVYASADPYAPEPWEQIAFITGTTYTYTGTDDKKFFKVTAVTEAPTKGSYYLSGRALNTKEMKPNISSAHTKKVTSVVAPKVKIENQRKK